MKKGIQMKDFETSRFFTQMDQNPLGYEGHYVVSDRMQLTEYHCHDYFEIYIHLHGGQYMGVDNQLFTLKPNQLFILPPFCMHGLSCTEEMHDYERAYLNLSPEVLTQLGCGQIDLPQFLRSRVSRGRYTYQLTDEDAAQFVSFARELKRSMPVSADPVDRFRDYALIMNAMNLVCQVLGRTAPEESDAMSNNIILDVLTYINSHYTDPLNVADLAKMFNVSSSYLAHEFSRFTHRSVYNYILYRRVMLARQQMLGDSSLNTIAYQCGFSDYSNFLRTFTKIAGISPSNYRKQLSRYSSRKP